MDFFQHRYYRLNKILMTLIGQWPYQSFGARCGIVVALVTVGGIQLTPLLMALVKYGDDGSILLDGALVLLFGGVGLMRFIGFMWNSKKTLTLLNRIRMDWYKWTRYREVNILHQYAERGRKMAIAYLVMNVADHTVFMAQPMMAKIIDLLMKNGTEPGTFPYPMDFYHLDAQKYYFHITLYSYVCGSTITMVTATNGVMLICYVQHVCGIFSALGHKIERLGNNRTLVETCETRYVLDKHDILLIAWCIDRHNDAIEYVNLIAVSYTWTFFANMGLGIIMFNIIGLQILMRTNDPESTIRYIVFIVTLASYFYIDFYISQAAADYSNSIYICTYNNQWYKLSLEAQKNLQFMMMRSGVSCQLTAGKMLVMSMRGFWLTAKTGISYLMFLRSTQGL